LSTALALELTKVCAELTEAPLARAASAAVVASSSERAFCAGADLVERSRLGDTEWRDQRRVFQAAFTAVRHLPMPTIAAVEGYALGGGCELALSCDVVVAGEGAVLGLPEVGLGLVPGCGGTQLLPRRVGPGVAADLIFTGRRVSGPEAHRLGLVDHLVPTGDALGRARGLADEIARRSPVSVRAAKVALRQGADQPLREGLRVEDGAWRRAAFSDDRREGVAAFVERRDPRWPSWGESGRPEPEGGR
jgi:enoyl-CoA hydratase/carnithine racemase